MATAVKTAIEDTTLAVEEGAATDVAAVGTVIVKIHDQVLEVTEDAFKYLCAWCMAIPTIGLAFHKWEKDPENAATGSWQRVTPADHAVPIEVPADVPADDAAE